MVVVNPNILTASTRTKPGFVKESRSHWLQGWSGSEMFLASKHKSLPSGVRLDMTALTTLRNEPLFTLCLPKKSLLFKHGQLLCTEGSKTWLPLLTFQHITLLVFSELKNIWINKLQKVVTIKVSLFIFCHNGNVRGTRAGYLPARNHRKSPKMQDSVVPFPLYLRTYTVICSQLLKTVLTVLCNFIVFLDSYPYTGGHNCNTTGFAWPKDADSF